LKSICLVNPPSPFLINEKVFVSLGILRVASSLERNGYEVKVLDLAGIEAWESEIDCTVTKYDIVGISSTTPQIPIVTKIAEYIKDRYKKSVILGGPHATVIVGAYKRELKNNLNSRATVEINRLKKVFDHIVCGDGEFSILAIMEGIDSHILDSELNDAWYLTEEKYNRLAFPARHLIDMDSYQYEIDGVKATNLICQMGCPFSCNFCSGRLSKTFKRIRSREISSVINEIDFLYKTYGYKGFMFYDDELNLNRKSFLVFLKALIAYQGNHQVKFNFRGFTRADLLTQEQADKMFEAGFKWLLTGFESGSDKMLINMNKKNSVADNTRTCKIAKNAGLKVKALMSIGHPGESFETSRETEDWVKLVQPDEVDITIISTYPGTPYYDDVKWDRDKSVWKYIHPETGDVLYSLDVNYMKDSVFYKSDPDNYESFVFTDYLSCQELVDERKRLESSLKGDML